VLPACRRLNLGVFSRVPLASGFLSGKYKPGATFKPGDVRADQDPQKVQEKLREAERIGREEVPPGVDMARWALAWCLRNEAVTAVIPGCKDVEQVESNAAAAELAPEDHPQAWD
jgi:aryl-alcohol dehydrogenase-like predicted oxidoreductase